MSKIIKYVILPACAIAIIVYEKYYAPSAAEVALKKASPLDFHNKIDSIYFDLENHNEEIAVFANGEKYAIYPDWRNEIKVGDSLSKDSNSYKIKRYRIGTTMKVLDYKILVKGFDK